MAISRHRHGRRRLVRRGRPATVLLASRSEEAAGALASDHGPLTDAERRQIGGVAAAEGSLGQILPAAGRPECADHLTRAAELFSRIGDDHSEFVAAAALGLAHRDVQQLRDLDQAEYWYRRSLEVSGMTPGSGPAPRYSSATWPTSGTVAASRLASPPTA